MSFYKLNSMYMKWIENFFKYINKYIKKYDL